MRQPGETTREVAADETRKQIVMPAPLRAYIKRRKEDNGLTYSQQVEAWLPDEWADIEFAVPDEEVVHIKATPAAHEKVMSMAGKRVSPGDVVAFYALVAAVRNGDYGVARRLGQQVAPVVWASVDLAEVADVDV